MTGQGSGGPWAWAAVLSLVFAMTAWTVQAEGRGCARPCGESSAGAGERGCGAGRGAAGAHREGMTEIRATFHDLLQEHDKIRRTVQDVEGGVATVTTSDDPEVSAKIRKHVRQMEQRMEQGQGLRRWDPLFVELFRHHDAIRMAIEDVPGGVRVIETSENPDVLKLIRQHARGVSEFVERGFARAHERSPLPEGYEAAQTDDGPGRRGGGCRGRCGGRGAARATR